jgi:site-specific DNA-methyltransferase (cytosine-N4-specific)
MVEVFDLVRELLADDGVLWLNLGDSYAANRGYQVPSTLMNGDATNAAQAGAGQGMRASDMGLKPKDLIGIPWRVAFALQAAGWYLRQDIIWAKPNPMPESVTDRCTKAHEYIFLLSKSERYYYDADAIAEESKYQPGGTHDDVKQGGFNDKGEIPGSGQRSFRAIRETRNKRSVWTVPTVSYSGSHFATFPPALIEPCILSGSRPGDIVLDPFFGSGTTGQVSQDLGRQWIGCELNQDYEPLQLKRTAQGGLSL